MTDVYTIAMGIVLAWAIIKFVQAVVTVAVKYIKQGGVK